MKRWYSLYIATLSMVLWGILIVSIIFISFMDTYLLYIPAPCKLFEISGKIFYTLSYAYISSFVFYLLTIHVPQVKNRIIIYKYVVRSFNLIISEGINLFVKMNQAVGFDKAFSNLTPTDIKSICEQLNPLTDAPIVSIDGTSLNWIGYLSHVKRYTDERIAEIRSQLPFLDVSTIDFVTSIAQHHIFSTIDLLSRIDNANRLRMSNFGGIQGSFVDYFKLLKRMQMHSTKYLEFYK